MASGYRYTRSEKAERAGLVAKGAYKAYGDTSAIERKVEKIDDRAADRYQREVKAHTRQLDAAKDEVAAAKVREKAASGSDRSAARAARKDAEKKLARVERARPR